MSEKCEKCSYITCPSCMCSVMNGVCTGGSGTPAGGTVISKMLAKTSVNHVNEKDPSDRPVTAGYLQGFIIQSDFTQVHVHAVKTHNFKIDFHLLI